MTKILEELERGRSGPRRPARRARRGDTLGAATARIGAELAAVAAAPTDTTLHTLRTGTHGLTERDAVERLEKYGENVVGHDRPPHWVAQLASTVKNPFIVVLICLDLVFFLTDDLKGMITLTTMVLVSVFLRFWQEFRSTEAAEALKAMVTTTATVIRRANRTADPVEREVPIEHLVPGDVVRLAAGDMIPADCRLLTSKDLFVSQAVLSGESLPVEKYDTLGAVAEKAADGRAADGGEPLESSVLCLMGTSVVSGSATAVVAATGAGTYFGSMAKNLAGARPETSFDRGVRSVSWVLIRFMLVMTPIVLVINGVTKGDWPEAFLFAVSVAVGLTPEMLPVIVTANLARGAIAMSGRKVIVKRLNAIQNFGAMDVLCTDKTGTLTEDRIVLERHLDTLGRPDDEVLEYAYLNSSFQTGLKNLLDRAIIDHVEEGDRLLAAARFTKIDEIPFDFTRRRMSVILEREKGARVLIAKGAVDEILDICATVREGRREIVLTDAARERVREVAEAQNREGLRVLAVATRSVPAARAGYGVADESELTLVGFVAFLDPPKASASAAISALHENGVAVKVITGDSEPVARKVATEVGLDVGDIPLGRDIDPLDDDELRELAEKSTVFAKVNPVQKARIIRALQAGEHTVGYLGDGINDAAALRDADVGISVDTAVDIAKESADIILLEKDLMVLDQGVVEGRRTFGNIMKYIKMTASSNFGNVFSVLVASAFLPFLPMLAVHLLVQNLCYDISQLSIPWDKMDKEYLRKPRKWAADDLSRFMLRIGPISSIFDITTYCVMWWVFSADTEARQTLFQSGWFIEGLLSQTLIVHMIRTRKVPFVQSRAATPVLVLTGVIMAIGIYLPFSPLADTLRMQSLPWTYFPILAATLLTYCALTQFVKTRYIRRYGTWL
ncbi:magnesium-translocating P-type ATPase [Embleya hyalina]|uniref:Magnesium-transporting ATPase, P-type 1 n=1 Tax=Embleya hyalina TaxID=516124 RepID=A0A401YMN9_9ACTN|nr:magnesium-translocating P-type ATPase [Embleya hyalina]GCD95861.1 magnesium-transporting ATPase [Embleya hyalina]